ncbi:DUF4097 domain-containing protein [Thermoactinospora rubra]|uniref:DUF4097 domain-containing protein n=1 Tax=Thermoactinospora rubra TaxID=1088767 RepID=UPI00117E2344|nr:DUF4097 domain-containing protein [Thermoactinospora rubra]
MKRMVIVLAGLATLTGCGIELDTDPVPSSRTFAHAGGELTVEADLGKLRIEPGAAAQVQVERRLRGKAARDGNNSWELKDGVLRLHARCEMVVGDCGADYTVRVPPDVELTVRGGDDPVSVVRLSGRVTVTTTGGAIRTSGLAGPLEARTAEGSISAVRTRSGEVVARTRDGGITLAFAAPPTRVEAISETGPVRAELPEADYRITADSETGKARSELRDAGPRSRRAVVARSVDGDVRLTRSP